MLESINLIELYFKYWILYTVSTWVFYFVGFAILNRVQSKSIDRPNSKLGKFFLKLYENLLDAPCNTFLSILPFFDLPAYYNELVTERLRRYKLLADNHRDISEILELQRVGLYINKIRLSYLNRWRYNVAVWVCIRLNKNGQTKPHC